jgi:predicted transposase YbfD/YdcC
LLLCLVAALLCNCNSLDAVGQWTREHEGLLRRVCGPRRHCTPTGSLYRRVLPRLSVAHVERALACWVRQTRPRRDREPIALDGKTVRGAKTATHAAPHLLSIVTHHSRETLVQVRVDDKTNEIPIAQEVLPHLAVRGRIVTADALHTQTDFAQTVLTAGGDYLLTVKGNQPHLYEEIATYFADAGATSHRTVTHDWQRGRKEERTLDVTTRLNHHLTRYTAFPGIGQVARLRRTVQAQGVTRTEDVYLLTSLSPRRADPARLLTAVRAHWQIESGHYVRDVTFAEDRSRLRSGHAPQIMASLRNLALTLLHRQGISDIAATRRHLAYQPSHALRLLISRSHSRR